MDEKPPDKPRLKVFGLINRNPVTDLSKNPAKLLKDRRSTRNEKEKHVPKSETPPKSWIAGPVPQVKLDLNSEIVLDEESLVIETKVNKKAREANSPLIVEDEVAGSSGFGKQGKQTREWSSEETVQFYRSLRKMGTDFSLMVRLLPNRSQKELKAKFKQEKKSYLHMVNKVLFHPKLFNIDGGLLEERKDWLELDAAIPIEQRPMLFVAEPKAACGLSDSNVVDKFEFAAKKKTDVNQTENVGETIPTKCKPEAKNTVSQQPSNTANYVNLLINQRRSSIEPINSPELFIDNQPVNLNQTQAGGQDRSHSKEILHGAPSSKNTRAVAVESEICMRDLEEHNEMTIPEAECEDPSNFSENSHGAPLSKITRAVSVESEICMRDLEEYNLIYDPDHNSIFSDFSAESDSINEKEPNDDGAVQLKTNEMTIPEAECEHPSNSSEISHGAPSSKATVEIEASRPVVEQIDPEQTDGGMDYDADANNNEDEEDIESLRESLAVVPRMDPRDANKVIHEVFMISPTTGELSEEPLDLPPDVIERIVKTMQVRT